jgi:diaminohydroxyphosphoribosylaminopyrimidine deaminase / 5-amino-6-(5-phosphoribosylamino)uracil reductase
VDTGADEAFLRRCLVLARRAEGRTSPNPVVGCVIVGKRGEVLAEGYHVRVGEAHAEAAAIARLVDPKQARGATVYVNLEPCNHTSERRTAPCAPKLAALGIARLVFGLYDPFPGHGGGAAMLGKAGVRVDGPLLEVECRRANAPFVTWATAGRAHVTSKVAMSLDGRIATRTGESQWITGPEARAFAHRLRDKCDAILVGAGTMAADDPLLTTRGVRGGRDPVRVVLDGRLSMSPKAKMLRAGSPAPTWVMTTREAPEAKVRALEDAGAVVIRLPSSGGKVSVRSLLATLGQRGTLSVLIEGGAQTHAAFMEAGLVDRLLVATAPIAIGGATAPSWLGGEGVARLAKAPRFTPVGNPRHLGDDLLVAYERAARPVE